MTNENEMSRGDVLVSTASKHGSTAEIGEHIAKVLRDGGVRAVLTEPAEVTDLARFRAVVLGSAVYAGRWLPAAKSLADRVGALESKPEVWLFSSGPIGDPPKPDEDPMDVADILEATSAREHRVFSGKIDKSKLGFGEKAILIAVRAPEGDFRDWDEIESWARDIATALTTKVNRAPTDLERFPPNCPS